MAIVYIAEFGPLFGPPNLATLPPITEQTLAITATSTPSATFSSGTGLIRVTGDAAFSLAYSKDSVPTATAAKMRFAASAVEYFGVNPGGRVAVIN